MLLIAASAHAQALAVDVCAMEKPPADSRVRSTHAGDLLTYPRSLPFRYTGCQVTWLEDGHRLATVHLNAGRVRSVELNDPNGRTKQCGFDAQGKLTTGDASECMPANRWAK